MRCVLTDVSHSKEGVHLAGSLINYLLGLSSVFVFIFTYGFKNTIRAVLVCIIPRGSKDMVLIYSLLLIVVSACQGSLVREGMRLLL